MLIRGVQCSYGGCLNIPAHLAFFMERKTASVYEIWRYYNSLGRVYSSPKVGDLAIITTSAGGTYGHVGIVKSVSGNTYVTIDGNSKDQ